VDGKWTLNDCGIVLITLLVNLLAAGSTSFPGVIITAWLIGAFVAGEELRQRVAARSSPAVPPMFSAWLKVALGFLLVGGCYLTAYNPLLQSRGHAGEAQYQYERGKVQQAAAAYRAAGSADPWSPTPWQELASLEAAIGMVVDWNRVEAPFTEACDKFIERAPHSFTAWTFLGSVRLRAYRNSGRDSYLEEAVLAYQRAIELYPNNSYLHAQLAWVHHLRRDEPAAKREAQEALRLDELHNHNEKKLAKLKLDDAGPESSTKTRDLLPKLTAREIVERIKEGKEFPKEVVEKKGEEPAK
jgi:tetratricopeptide (TPR) repeat protein